MRIHEDVVLTAKDQWGVPKNCGHGSQQGHIQKSQTINPQNSYCEATTGCPSTVETESSREDPRAWAPGLYIPVSSLVSQSDHTQ